jgi:copper transport protein
VAFIALIADKRPLPGRTEWWIWAVLVGGLIASALSLGLQGLDALAQPLAQISRPDIWMSGLATSYGSTAVIAAVAMLLGLAAMRATPRPLILLCALGALVGVGSALAASGHASTAEPQLVSRPAVFLHGICIAFWVGSLVPLVSIVRDPQRGHGELKVFSRWIPVPLAVLIATGTYLIWIQLDRPDALWTRAMARCCPASFSACWHSWVSGPPTATCWCRNCKRAGRGRRNPWPPRSRSNSCSRWRFSGPWRCGASRRRRAR